MFGGVDHPTKESILKKVTEYQIFSHYCKNFKELNKPFLSELYIDTKASCRIIYYNGKLLYKDFGNGSSFNCFSYIMAKYNCTFNECLKIIANDFGFIKHIKDFKIVPSANYVGLPDKNFGNSKTALMVKFRRWYPKIDTYFYDYYITDELLRFYNVKALEYYWVAEKGDSMFLAYKYKDNIFDPAYSYEEGDEYRKILRPYNKNYKWTSNVPRRYYQGYKQLDNTGDILIVTSSLKDVMIWRTFGYNAICPTGETVFLTDNALELLSYRFKKIFLNYDNDDEGIKQSKKIKEQYNIDSILTPNYKDISDYIYFQGYDKTNNLIKNLI
jgi:hypothetical protein